MKWLHLSDIHFNPSKDGADSLYLRKCLLDFLKQKNIVVDKIFLTGDFRDASCQDGTDEAAKDIANFIFDIADSVGVKRNSDILLVPGNHDLTRNFNQRQEVITQNKNSYDSGEGILKNLDILTGSFEFYKKIVTEIKGKDNADNLFENLYKITPHTFLITDEVNILQLNTELLAGEVISQDKRERVLDDGSLCVGTKYVISALSLIECSPKPTIVLAHRGLDLLNSFERKKLLNIFQNFKVCMYLCGHSHDLWYDEASCIPQITVGCIKQQSGVRAGFAIGNYDSASKKIEVEAFSWENDRWGEYSHFSPAGHKITWDISDKVAFDEDEFRSKIKIVINGKVREFRGNVIDMKHTIDHSPMMSCIAGSLILEIANTEFTKDIKFNDKFILSQNVWKIIGIDDTAKFTITVTCEKELRNPSEDDMESGIANKSYIRD